MSEGNRHPSSCFIFVCPLTSFASSVEVTATPSLSHLPKPSSSRQKDAKEAYEELSEEMQDLFEDYISMDALNDPIEMHGRVYNRDTVTNILNHSKSDPLTRKPWRSVEAKSADYILDAIIVVAKGSNEEKQEFIEKHEATEVKTLKDVVEAMKQDLGNTPSMRA